MQARWTLELSHAASPQNPWTVRRALTARASDALRSEQAGFAMEPARASSPHVAQRLEPQSEPSPGMRLRALVLREPHSPSVQAGRRSGCGSGRCRPVKQEPSALSQAFWCSSSGQKSEGL